MEPQERPAGALGKNRVEALSDGIFAFAMTILVLNIEFPETLPLPVSNEQALGILATALPGFLHYVTAFIVLASFWISHHKCYDRLRATDGRLVWMNIIGLLLLVLVPFTSDLADSYVGTPLTAFVFEVNVLLVGLVIFAQWDYAMAHRSLLEKGVTDAEMENARKRMTVLPAISLVAMALAGLGFSWTVMLYFLTPVAMKLYAR